MEVPLSQEEIMAAELVVCKLLSKSPSTITLPTRGNRHAEMMNFT